jgi:subfamily B ATP-binding cassette protein MsbA
LTGLPLFLILLWLPASHLPKTNRKGSLMFKSLLGDQIVRYAKAHRWLIVWSLILSLLSSLFVVIPAYLLQPFVDKGMEMGSGPVTWKIPWISLGQEGFFSWHRTKLVLLDNVSPNRLLVVLTLVAFAAVLLNSATGYLSKLAAVAFSNRVIRSLRIDLFRKFVSLPMCFYHKRKSGELVARATADLTVMQGQISNVIIGLIEYPMTAAVFLVFLFIRNYRLTLLIFIIGPLLMGLFRFFGRKVKKHAARVQDANAEAASAYQETILCLKVVHGFFQGDFEVERFKALADHLYKRTMRWRFWHLGLSPMMDIAAFLVLPGVLIAGKVFFRHSLGEMVSMLYALSKVYQPAKHLSRVSNDLKTLQGATQKVLDILRTPLQIQDRPSAATLPRHKESIEFRDVHFGYEGDGMVLKDISFRVNAGEMVAFVGSTGAGKSSLLSLIPRFYDVSAGGVIVDGWDVRNVTLASLRRQIGVVHQEIILFHDTIANNIRYGDPTRGLEEVISAARAAHAHDFILAQPKGYDTVIGDQGTLLSGGQRQRIAIARAILVNPSILLLDEAVSALDAESERHINEAIHALRKDRTILVVAHRLSTILNADRIYVLEEGRILESGTVETLLGRNGRFRQLYDLQFRDHTESGPGREGDREVL